MSDEAANQDVAENLSKESKSELEPSTTNSVLTSSSSSEVQGITTDSDSKTSIKSISELPEKKVKQSSPEKSPVRDSNKGLENLYKLIHLGQSSKNFNSTEEEPKAESRNENFDNKRPFKYLSNENLKTRDKLINESISKLLKENESLATDISDIKDRLTTIPYGEDYRKHNRDVKSKEREIESIEEKCKKLGEELHDIGIELKLRETEKGNERSSEVQVGTKYREGDLADDIITNVVLYTAIYFNGLPINDFKEVVLNLLNGTKGKVENKFLPQSKSESEQLISKLITVNLGEYWKENLLQSDRFLEACSLEAKYNNGLMVVEFTSENTRRSIFQYFEKNKLSFRNEQLNRVEYLLFHKSQRVSDKAAQLLAESAQEKSSNWLLEIVQILKKDFSNFEYGHDRISQLIYQIQLKLVPEDSEKILVPFFNELLNLENFGAQPAIDTIFLLIYKHLQYKLEFNIQNAVTQLMEWLKKIIDDIDTTQQNYTEKNVTWLLSQNDSSNYLYDFLELLYKWLPQVELEKEAYSSSHKLATKILSQYCLEALDHVSDEDYGKWASEYALFKSLYHEKNRLNNLNLLVRWLFYSNNQTRKILVEDPDSIADEFIEIAFIVAEWFCILYGLRKDDKLNLQASNFAKDILKQIIEVTDRRIQRRLVDCWSMLIDYFLNLSEEYDQEGNTSLRKKFSVRRSRTKELKKIFKELQQEAQKEESNSK